jgi:asparagine synthase (glutamine-hydrolysing)
VLGLTGHPERGLAAIRRRGPDQAGRWLDSQARIWLGHRRLSIIDLSETGAQPMQSPDGRYVMVYNGEVYNYRELRAEMEAAGESFAGTSDTEVVLRLFQRDGCDAFKRLNGIFALAIWNRAEDRLTLARDPMGVKPLYIARTRDGGIAFASEIKALVRAGDVTPALNDTAALRHLGFLWSPGRGTIMAGVEKLLPGERLEMRLGDEPTIETYADPALPDPQRPPIASVDEAVAAVRTGVEDAVKRQLVADVPLGSFLSGGLDSSAIATFASRHRDGPGRLQCFSIEIATGDLGSEGFADDLGYARRVADHLGTDLHIVQADTGMCDRLREMVYFLDEPTADLAALNTLLISELARASGMTVLLSGSGGDDIFTGYRRHLALSQEKRWNWLPRPARSGLRAASSLLPKDRPLARRVAKAFQYADRDADERLISYFYWIDPDRAGDLLHADRRRGFDAAAMAAPMRETLARIPDGATPLERMLYLECRHFLTDHNLNYADKMGMAASIEIRVPLIDLELVNIATRLPESIKQRGRIGKWVFKKAMEGLLPDDVIYRPKTGFGVPLRQWIVGPLAPLVRDALSPEKIAARGLFDAAAVGTLIEANRAGRIDASYTILSMLCLELWCQQFIDGDFAVDPAIDDHLDAPASGPECERA